MFISFRWINAFNSNSIPHLGKQVHNNRLSKVDVQYLSSNVVAHYITSSFNAIFIFYQTHFPNTVIPLLHFWVL